MIETMATRNIGKKIVQIYIYGLIVLKAVRQTPSKVGRLDA